MPMDTTSGPCPTDRPYPACSVKWAFDRMPEPGLTESRSQGCLSLLLLSQPRSLVWARANATAVLELSADGCAGCGATQRLSMVTASEATVRTGPRPI